MHPLLRFQSQFSITLKMYSFTEPNYLVLYVVNAIKCWGYSSEENKVLDPGSIFC